VEGVRSTVGEGVAVDGDDDDVAVEGSSGKGEDACCCCWVSLLFVLVSTRVAAFAEAGITLGGFDELKKRPPGGFENRE
jgi:hypothetical protein